MNIIINGFNSALYADLLSALLSRVRPEFAALLTECDFSIPEGIDFERVPVWDAVWARYRVDWSRVAPLDEHLVLSMAECEAVVLRMMDRLEHWRTVSYSDRKLMYLRHVRFWNDYLDRKWIDFFLSSNIPHEVYDYIIDCLCRRKHIPTLFLHQAPTIPDRVFLMSDYRYFMSELKDEYERRLSDSARINPDAVMLPQEIQEYYARQISLTAKPVPFYMRSVPPRSRLQGLSSRLRKGMITLSAPPRETRMRLIRAWNSFQYKKRMKARSVALSAAYERRSTMPESGERYIYVPLHFQPELTTSPLAGAFVDQQLIVQMLSIAAPGGVKIYVKEHPRQNALGRSGGFYGEMAGLANVRLVPKNRDSFALIDGCIAVATATGTAGWEALFRGKPVLLFGSFFYQYADGVYRVKTTAECRHALDDIIAAQRVPDAGKLKMFLKTTIDGSIHGVIDDVYVPISNITPEQNTRNLLDALLPRMLRSGLRTDSSQGE